MVEALLLLGGGVLLGLSLTSETRVVADRGAPATEAGRNSVYADPTLDEDRSLTESRSVMPKRSPPKGIRATR